MRRIRILFAILFLLSFLTPLSSAGEDVDTLLKAMYTSPHEARGAYDMFLGELETLFKDNLRSPALPVLYNRINHVLANSTDPSRLDGFYANLARLGRDRGLANGHLGTVAMIQHRHALLRKGDTEGAAALNAFAPYARRLLAIGPFGFGSSNVHDVVYPPEKPLEALNQAPGYAGPVEWVMVERDADKANFNLFESLYPRKGCCYALYQFRVMKETPMLLSFSTQASAKVWFNGRLLDDIDRRRAYLPERYIWSLMASREWNRVLIKISSGTPMFTLKVMNRRGYPLEGLQEMEEPTLAPPPSSPSGNAQDFDMGRVDALAYLKTYNQLHSDNPLAAIALADTLDLHGLKPEAIAEGERALDLAPSNPFILCMLGRLYEDAGYLPRNYRNHRAREFYKKTLEVDADFLPARLALALNDHKNDRSEEAIEAINKVLDKNPQYYGARMALITIFDKREWRKELLQAIKEARLQAPRDPEPLLLQARYYQSIHRHDLASQLYQNALELDKSRIDVIEGVASYLWDQDKKADALALYEKVLAIVETDFNHERLAHLHHALGDPLKAKEIYEQLRDKNARDPYHYKQLGDLALALDENDRAAAWYRKALEQSPAKHVLREMLADWNLLEDPVFREYAVEEGEEYIKHLPGKEEYPKASAICSLDHQITKVYADGSRKSEIFQIFKILDKDAVEEFGRLSVPGRILTLKVINPTGEILEPVDVEKRGVFNIPGLDVGSVLVMRFIMFESDSVGEPLRLGQFYFQDPDCSKPYLFSRYVLSLPKDMNVHIERTLPDRFTEERVEKEFETIHVFTARNAPVAEREYNMPPMEDAFPNVDIYQSGDWIQAAQRMANDIFPACKPTKELRSKAVEITAGPEGELEKARKLYAFVNEHVKEEQGSSRATSVLLEGRGSRTALFMALMDAAGIAYDYLRCGLRPGYLDSDLNWSDVSDALLPNELIRIRPEGKPAQLVSLDSRMTPFGEIPPYLYGAPAMKVTGKPMPIETLPGGHPITWLDKVIELKVKVNLTDAAVEGRFYLPGYNRNQFKEGLQRLDDHNRRQLFESRILPSIYPGARIMNLEIRGVEGDEEPPAFVFDLDAKDFIQPLADKDSCKLLPVPLNFMRAFVGKTERTFPYLYRGYVSQKLVMEIDLGTDYEIMELPHSLVERSFFINYALIVSRKDGGIRIERRVDFLPADIRPESYPDLIDTLRRIDEREVEPILLKRNPEAGSPAGDPSNPNKAKGNPAGESGG